MSSLHRQALITRLQYRLSKQYHPPIRFVDEHGVERATGAAVSFHLDDEQIGFVKVVGVPEVDVFAADGTAAPGELIACAEPRFIEMVRLLLRADGVELGKHHWRLRGASRRAALALIAAAVRTVARGRR